MAPRKQPRRGGTRKGFKLTKPRRATENYPGTHMVPDEITGNAQRGAWKRGWEAGRAGKTLRSNPYSTVTATYARGLNRLWIAGFHASLGA